MAIYNTLILGASYGSLLATKLLFAGHKVKLVCLPAEAELINNEGARVRLPIKGRKDPVEIDTRKLPGSLSAAGPGEVLVTDKTDPDWEPVMKRAAAIVTNRGGRTCHAAIVSRELGVPAIVGTGKQALSQIGTMLAVRPIRRVQVFSPTADKRAAFVAKAREEFGIEIADCSSVEAACKGAQIVTLVTRATQPFLTPAMLEPGTHLNAVGAIAPDREEFTQDMFSRVTAVAVDNAEVESSPTQWPAGTRSASKASRAVM